MEPMTIVTIVGVTLVGAFAFFGGLKWIGEKIADVAGKLATLTSAVTIALDKIEKLTERVTYLERNPGGDDN